MTAKKKKDGAVIRVSMLEWSRLSNFVMVVLVRDLRAFFRL